MDNDADRLMATLVNQTDRVLGSLRDLKLLVVALAVLLIAALLFSG